MVLDAARAMAKAGPKKRAQENLQRLQLLFYVILLTHGLFALVRLGLHRRCGTQPSTRVERDS